MIGTTGYEISFRLTEVCHSQNMAYTMVHTQCSIWKLHGHSLSGMKLSARGAKEVSKFA